MNSKDILKKNNKKEKEQKEKSLFWQAVSLVFQFGYTITIPLILFALLGRLLDKTLNSSPIIFLTAIVLSIVISSVLLFIKIKKIMIEIK